MSLAFIGRAVGAVKLAAKAHAPTLLVTGGVVSMAAGTVVACKKTLYIEEILEPHTAVLENIEKGEALNLDGYGSDKARSDRFRVYSRAAFDCTKHYAVPGTLFIGGAVMVFSGHRIMLKRNATLAVAFTTLFNSFRDYRGRVVQKMGHDADQAFMHGAVVKEVIDPETGEVATIATRDWDESSTDPYNRVFEQGATSAWVPDLGINKMFIANQQRFAQDLLSNRGYLYLSEVYEALGFPESDISRVVGWKVTRLPDGSKDIPMVDFGLDKPMPDDWKYDRERAVYLDFNCQGLIVGGRVQKILERA